MPAPPHLPATHREETFTLTGRRGGVDVVAEVVIDPADGSVLSVRYAEGGTDAESHFVAVLSSGWTDEAPGVPATDVP